jgi:hypothetical protein
MRVSQLRINFKFLSLFQILFEMLFVSGAGSLSGRRCLQHASAERPQQKVIIFEKLLFFIRERLPTSMQFYLFFLIIETRQNIPNVL